MPEPSRASPPTGCDLSALPRRLFRIAAECPDRFFHVAGHDARRDLAPDAEAAGELRRGNKAALPHKRRGPAHEGDGLEFIQRERDEVASARVVREVENLPVPFRARDIQRVRTRRGNIYIVSRNNDRPLIFRANGVGAGVKSQRFSSIRDA